MHKTIKDWSFSLRKLNLVELSVSICIESVHHYRILYY